MFEMLDLRKDGLYITRNGWRAERLKSEDKGGWLAFRILWDGYTAIEHYDQAGRYLGRVEHPLDIVGMLEQEKGTNTK